MLCVTLFIIMSKLSENDITRMLLAVREGNANANDELFSAVYDVLKRIAGSFMRRERGNHTLQPTALVNEAYLRLVNQSEIDWENRTHFFGIAANLMRQILVDHARSYYAAKRGGHHEKVLLEEALIGSAKQQQGIDVLLLDEALKKFAEVDPAASRLVELRYFGGLSVEETAKVLGVSASTVKRDWKDAKQWLRRELSYE